MLMKRILYLLLSVFPLVSLAQDYDYYPFVAEGKTWECLYTTDMDDWRSMNLLGLDNCKDHLLYYRIQGDTLINSLSYKKVFCQSEKYYGDTLQHYWCAVRECDRQVFVIQESTMQEILMYDFNNREDTITLSYGEQTFYRSKVLLHLPVTDRPEAGNLINLWYRIYGKDEEGFYAVGAQWLERVGTLHGPFSPMKFDISFPWFDVMSCEENGIFIFLEEEFTEIASIKGVNDTNRHPKASFFDLQGRRLSAAPSRGIYIQDGKKHIR
jgi:hypothetical protein